jgi:hypothetical protein
LTFPVPPPRAGIDASADRLADSLTTGGRCRRRRNQEKMMVNGSLKGRAMICVVFFGGDGDRSPSSSLQEITDAELTARAFHDDDRPLCTVFLLLRFVLEHQKDGDDDDGGSLLREERSIGRRRRSPVCSGPRVSSCRAVRSLECRRCRRRWVRVVSTFQNKWWMRGHCLLLPVMLWPFLLLVDDDDVVCSMACCCPCGPLELCRRLECSPDDP